MKKSVLKLFIISLMLFFSVSQAFGVSQEIIGALNSGNALTLSSFFDNNIELVVESRGEIFSRQQASNIVADFFRRNPVKNFNIRHRGEREGESFIIGTLQTTNGSFRMYVLTRKNGNNDVIQQFRIESEGRFQRPIRRCGSVRNEQLNYENN